MIIRRNLLHGLGAGAATVSLSSHSVLAAADVVLQSGDEFEEYLGACVIASEESEVLDQNINPVDYWTCRLSNVHEKALPKGCRKVVILDDDILPDGIAQGFTKLYRSVHEDYDFNPLDHPHHFAPHLDDVTDLRERIQSILTAKSANASRARVALFNAESGGFYCSFKWLDILPDLRAHYERVVVVWVNWESEKKPDFIEPDFDEEAYNADRRKRRDEFANHCETVVEISDADIEKGKSTRHWITKLTRDVADVLLRKSPAEISALPTCGVIAFRDWMALVA